MFSIIACTDSKGGIAKDNSIPWRNQKDMQFFQFITSTASEGKKNAVIMGSRTYFSIPEKKRPLIGRHNIVISSKDVPDVKTVRSFKESLLDLSEYESVFVIGGERVYREAIQHPLCKGIFLSVLDVSYDCDLFFPSFYLRNYNLEGFDRLDSVTINTYKRLSVDDIYLNLVKNIIINGEERTDRTGTGTISLFGESIKIPLDKFPLLTTKKMFFKGVSEELLWMLSGCTDSKVLSNRGVKIWDFNGSRDFLDKVGFKDRKVGDLGPIYGFQWRHFGAEYKGCEQDYKGKGVDQISNIIKQILQDPFSRRIVLNSWNASDLDKMALPPCHVMCQFYVEGDGLKCHLTQRSADVGLGLPFNIASYALLTYLIGYFTGKKPLELTISLGDSHVYKNHLDSLLEQRKRKPYPSPTLDIVGDPKDIFSVTPDNLVLKYYESHPSIKMEIS